MADTRTKPRKEQRYPKKFRMKLEKMRAERAAREAPEDALLHRISNTLIRELLPPNSVHLMHSKISEYRLTTVMQIHPEPAADFFIGHLPWAPLPPDDPESQASS